MRRGKGEVVEGGGRYWLRSRGRGGSIGLWDGESEVGREGSGEEDETDATRRAELAGQDPEEGPATQERLAAGMSLALSRRVLRAFLEAHRRKAGPLRAFPSGPAGAVHQNGDERLWGRDGSQDPVGVAVRQTREEDINATDGLERSACPFRMPPPTTPLAAEAHTDAAAASSDAWSFTAVAGLAETLRTVGRLLQDNPLCGEQLRGWRKRYLLLYVVVEYHLFYAVLLAAIGAALAVASAVGSWLETSRWAHALIGIGTVWGLLRLFELHSAVRRSAIACLPAEWQRVLHQEESGCRRPSPYGGDARTCQGLNRPRYRG
ncbi:hypothetical protein CDCA_CDCA07G2216 [Cyanidium caldarium]|uniref:Uncharacterized protein n=1 Tax=Cyanidium caldarium TaxID=2771 RepID=A0AAV9IVR1_CYACA|nr:hypothetical protein CDCA_CDCA07G2216 [Cyanidium caldarium]